MLKTRSVHSPIDPAADGLRVLATRFRGRGMPASRYDVWLPALGPSEELLAQVLAGKVTWAAFLREYRKEVVMDGPVDARCATIKNHGQKSLLRLLARLSREGHVTLLCHCAEDAKQCHRFELAKLVERAGA